MKLKAEKIIEKFKPGGTHYDKATDEQKKTALFLIDLLSPDEVDIPYVADDNKEDESLKRERKEAVENKVRQEQVVKIEKKYMGVPVAPAGGGPPKKTTPVPSEKKDKKGNTKPKSSTGSPVNPDDIYKQEGIKTP